MRRCFRCAPVGGIRSLQPSLRAGVGPNRRGGLRSIHGTSDVHCCGIAIVAKAEMEMDTDGCLIIRSNLRRRRHSSARNRQTIGCFVSRVRRPGSTPVARVIADLKANAKADGLTDAAPAAYNTRVSRPRHYRLGRASMRPGRSCPGCPGCPCIRHRHQEKHRASMRPGRLCPGCSHSANALHIKAISLALRAPSAMTGRASQLEQHAYSRCQRAQDFQPGTGFERIRGRGRRERARKLPAGTMHHRPVAILLSAQTLRSFYMTVAWRRIFENVLPMLSIASSIRSAGPTSISST